MRDWERHKIVSFKSLLKSRTHLTKPQARQFMRAAGQASIDGRVTPTLSLPSEELIEDLASGGIHLSQLHNHHFTGEDSSEDQESLRWLKKWAKSKCGRDRHRLNPIHYYLESLVSQSPMVSIKRLLVTAGSLQQLLL